MAGGSLKFLYREEVSTVPLVRLMESGVNLQTSAVMVPSEANMSSGHAPYPPHRIRPFSPSQGFIGRLRAGYCLGKGWGSLAMHCSDQEAPEVVV